MLGGTGDKIVLLDGAGSNGGSAAEAGLYSMIPALFANAFGGNKMDPNLVAALMNGRNNQDNFGGNGAWFLWIILLFGLFGRGFGGWGGNGAWANGLPQQLNTDYGNQLLLQAINGNRSAIEQISSTLGCNTTALQNSLFTIQNAITQVAGQAGANYQGVVNAIQANGREIGRQICDCCCDTKSLINQTTRATQNMIMSRGYEGQIETLNQTNQLQNTINNGLAQNRETATGQFNILSAKIDAQTQVMNDKFCQLEKRELQSRIDSLKEEKNALQMSALLQQQSRYVIDTVRPCPIPSFNTCNPWGCNGGFYGYGVSGCGNGCGTGSCCCGANA